MRRSSPEPLIARLTAASMSPASSHCRDFVLSHTLKYTKLYLTPGRAWAAVVLRSLDFITCISGLRDATRSLLLRKARFFVFAFSGGGTIRLIGRAGRFPWRRGSVLWWLVRLDGGSERRRGGCLRAATVRWDGCRSRRRCGGGRYFALLEPGHHT